MAENKEITTLHPYMNRNKNRYPNVKEENIPDTIQRKMTAGTGINISPDNVISATGGDSYTRSETDALLDTKADKVSLENVNKVVPTDIAVKDGKLGLEHNTTWLTNQKAINLGENITYDATTNTLNASGDKLPTGSYSNPFIVNGVKIYNEISTNMLTIFNDKNVYNYKFDMNTGNNGLYIDCYSSAPLLRNCNLSVSVRQPNVSTALSLKINSRYQKNIYIDIDTLNADKPTSYLYVPALQRPSADGNYYLKITKTGDSYHYDWVAGGGKTYNHYIVISDGTASNAIYLLIPSTNSLICSSLPELDTLLGTTNRFIQASGVVTNAASKLPIVALNWQGSIATSKILTMSSEEATTKFTDISDIVEPA